jgi:predicted ATPase
MKYHKVKQHSELLRDPHSKAVVNTDHKAYMKHLQEKRRAEEIRATGDRVASVESDINMLRNEMTEIKQLLMQVVSQTKVN